MKKNFGKSFIILITFLVLVSVVFSRNNIGSWTIDVSGLSDSYNLEMYFDNGQTYCNLYNMTNGTTYSGQMDIFNPIISSNGTYGVLSGFNRHNDIMTQKESRREADVERNDRRIG